MPERLAPANGETLGIHVIIGSAPQCRTAFITPGTIRRPAYQGWYHMTMLGFLPTRAAYRSSTRRGWGLFGVTPWVVTPNRTGCRTGPSSVAWRGVDPTVSMHTSAVTARTKVPILRFRKAKSCVFPQQRTGMHTTAAAGRNATSW